MYLSTEPEYVKFFVIFSPIKPITTKLELNKKFKLFFTPKILKHDDSLSVCLKQNSRKISGFMKHSASQGTVHNEKLFLLKFLHTALLSTRSIFKALVALRSFPVEPLNQASFSI